MATIVLDKLTKSYDGEYKAVNEANLTIKDKEFCVLLGPSGCGKTTLLRMIAGLESITGGELYLDKQQMNNVLPKDRDIAMVFQSYALYPHMDVYKNMAFGLKMKKVNKSEIDNRIKDAAKYLDLEQYLDRKPRNLSGGQQQRVALGRALVKKPKVFLMDEPLSNLDAKLRQQTRETIVKIHRDAAATTIYVTHDQVEAMTMGSKIVVMSKGVIQQIGTPEEIFEAPKNMFVAGFIGSPSINFVKGVYKQGVVEANSTIFRISKEQQEALSAYEGKEITMGIRPEYIFLPEENEVPKSDTYIKLKVDFIERLGSELIINGYNNVQRMVSKVRYSRKVMSGEEIEFNVDIKNIHFFDNETQLAICKMEHS